VIEQSSINHPDVTLFIWLIDFALDFDERISGFGQFRNLSLSFKRHLEFLHPPGGQRLHVAW
jgi:hypothetical protein